jgi:hypothetical protein
MATRDMAATSLEAVLREVMSSDEPISEVALRDRWLHSMQQKRTVYSDGWYMPPPHGMIMLFATDTDPSRIMSDNYRRPEKWSRSDVLLSRDSGMIMAYASPVDRATGMIGDFGVMLYFGKDPDVQQHLVRCLRLNQEIAKRTNPGMRLSDVAHLANDLMEERGLSNTVFSMNDPTGTNIGHTLPAAYEGWNDDEKAILDSGGWDAAKDMISRKRLFVSMAEEATIKPGMAFTVEPRPQSIDRPDIPMVAYHTILAFEPNHKHFLTDFDELFVIAGMDYMPTSPRAY